MRVTLVIYINEACVKVVSVYVYFVLFQLCKEQTVN